VFSFQNRAYHTGLDFFPVEGKQLIDFLGRISTPSGKSITFQCHFYLFV
jgi:hypothetical protein